MGARSSGREAALQLLFAFDTSGGAAKVNVERLIEDYWLELEAEADGRSFANELFRAVVTELEQVDEHIRGTSRHWRIERMPRVDRNVLRLGVKELLDANGAPRAVIIDEAVELAKRFGASGSSVFVNGVLDRIAEDLKR